ncbi:MAG: GIY-YIG nuclease family protein [Thermoanaerobaculia bacterium]
MGRTFFVYILSSNSKTLYIGVTNNLIARLLEHREGVGSKFTARYKATRLVYFEAWNDATQAITREKELKGWRREKKIELIESVNPAWSDLIEEASLHSGMSGPRWHRDP